MDPNDLAVERICAAEPVLIDIQSAGEALPGMQPNMILTSGPTVPFDVYSGGQRDAIVYGALYEGLADDQNDAVNKLNGGAIVVEGCHDHGCVASVAGIYTASMPVFVVENATAGNRGFCNFYEGESRRRLNYGAYDAGVRDQLRFLEHVVAPTLRRAVRANDGVALRPLMRRALHMGDELHSRNTAATLLFGRELFPHLLADAVNSQEEARRTLEYLAASDYFFLRLSMAAGKAAADAGHGVDGSTVVTAMTIWCQGTGIRVSGLGDAWHLGPFPSAEARFFEGHTADDLEWIGGESPITETVGLGGFAQAAAFPLQNYQGGSAEAMMSLNLAMYDITVAEHPHYRIPVFDYRGTPVGIDVRKVLQTGVTPVLDAGLAGKGGGQIGAGVVRMPIECFQAAAAEIEVDAHAFPR